MSLKSLGFIALICGLTIFSGNLSAQSFSFNCGRDTLIAGCDPVPCFTLKGIIPDLRGLSSTYNINPTSTVTGCAPVYVQPNDPAGTPTNLTVDDTYSSVINIGFPFPFFGTTYNSLIASTNGMVSFDISKAGLGAHYTTTPGDLPNTSYDRAIIMGPYHDLDPSIGSSPNQRIQYQNFGTAPHRRWVFSFYKVPLYSSSGVCDALIENTHQIILYESTGIIEVTVFSKQVCTAWQSGKAMIGMQDFNRTQSIMAPNRRISDPPWGAVGMNESWRFVPSSGPSLFKRVELTDLAGNIITAGSVVDIGNGRLEASFPNICPPAGATTPYIIRSVYQKIDDPLVEIFGTDTVRVTKGPPTDLNATAASTATSCGPPSGTITVSVPTGTPPFTYTLDPGPGQVVQTGASPMTFTSVTAGSHTVYVTDASGVCSSTVPVTVTQNNNLTATITPSATSCPGVNNGSLAITPTIGTAPYTFTLNPGNIVRTGATALYTGLAAGAYTISITDASGCNTSPALNASVSAGAGLTANTIQTPTSCAGATNGRITVNPTNGAAPYTFLLDGITTQTGATADFTGLAAGAHTIRITDAVGCVTNPDLIVTVAAGPVLAANATGNTTSCSSATNGTITVTPTNGTGPYNFLLNPGAIAQTGATASYTGLAAGAYTVTVSDASGCVSNAIPVDVFAGPALTTTATHTNVLCNGGATGSITVAVPAIGTGHEYSLDNINWQASNVFNGLIAGNYTVYFREANGCTGQLNRTITEPPVLTGIANVEAALCNGQNNGRITIIANGGTAPYEYSINGGANWQSSNIFTGIANNYSIIIRDANLCTVVQSATITEPPVLTATAATTNATCNGGNDGTITVTATGGNGNYEYSINGGANWQSSNVFNVAPNNYTVDVRDNLGCTYQFTTTVGLTNDLVFTPQVDATICESKSTQLELVSNAIQYAWTPATGLSSTTIHNPVASPAVTTTYTVTATLGRCSADDIVVVNVNPAPIPNAGADAFICYGQTYTLQGSGGMQYTWTPSTYLSSSSGPNPVVTPERTITYTLSKVIDANGCESLTTDDVIVDVTPPIKINTFPYDTVGYPGDTFRLRAIPAVPTANIFTWTPTTGLSNPGVSNPIVTVGNIGDDIVYRVTAETTAGCKGEGYVRIRVYKGPEMYVPTGFTPNGDGLNDKFTPFPVGMKSITYFRVFNRWGQLIFSTSKLNDGWDGTMRGTPQPSGTYVWMVQGITKDDKPISKKGVITLIR